MLKFVILSSNKENIRGYETIVDKLLMKNETEYKCYKFNDNDKEFYNFIEKQHDENIYIIEEENSINSLDIIKYIRNNHNDLTSFIIITDFKNKIERNCIENNYCIHTKVISNNEQLSNTLSQIIKLLNNNNDRLVFKYNSYIHNINFCEILYIEKQLDSKLCKIICTEGTYYINKSLKKVKELLNNDFVQTHQSAIVNINNVSSIDLANKIINFKNNHSTTLFARNYKKKVETIFTKKDQKVTQ